MSQCGICLEDKNKEECLSFPCCNNSFTICKQCLVKNQKICPHCRTPYTLESTYKSTYKCNWTKLLDTILYVFNFVCYIYINIILYKIYNNDHILNLQWRFNMMTNKKENFTFRKSSDILSKHISILNRLYTMIY